MRLFPHWAKARAVAKGTDGRAFAVTAWGWSARDTADAQAQAETRARLAAQKLAAGGTGGHYGYLERPLREEELDRTDDAAGRTQVAVTRNGYGARILNAADAMFVDVDLPASGALETLVWRLTRMFSRETPSPRARHEAAALALLEPLAKRDPVFGARVYRTCAGLRYLVTHRTADPEAEETLATMRALRADPLYIKLTRAQACFRARLTPKPWRVGLPEPRERWPWRDSATEGAFREWERRYQAASVGHATCAFMTTVGNPAIDPALVPVVERHDRETAAASGLPLA